jgi:ribosomal-protein-alanine N-acetyltransferase
MISNDFKIITDRLILRPFNENDDQAMLSIQSKPIMVQYTPDDPWKGIEDAYEFLRFTNWLYRDIEDRKWFRYYFAVIEKSLGKLIGYCGIGGPQFDRTLTEVLYGIDNEYWGKGYATEITKALLKYGFNELGLSKIVGFAEKENIASLRVLEKAGLTRNGEISGLPEEFTHFNGESLFEITKEEWVKETKTI